MSGGNEVARNLLAQEPGRDYRHANAADIPNIAPQKRKRHNSGTFYRVTPSTGDPFRIVVTGRDRWALEELRRVGAKGCTPIDNPAPRWSAYVFNLRALGLDIETVTEPHGGDYAGHHGRYVLRSGVTLDWKGGAA
ncbi:hypothetical protein [Primorskyibacter flagellatus]|uniref:Winged helix domain-containing protein n=1 Tax=Primorskyibacter flagellatus TaxID=1387277 RepID=A0A1W2B5D7_9RHOB|nr:hypothetical protein [Primorskyibacter flagellatus]SMC67598.1 hypothetical protein SAMN06295998_103483 [Primorskyibacter flagellatus]